MTRPDDAARPQASPARKLQLIAPKRRFATALPIPVVQERIYRDWRRGVSELALSKMYGQTRESIERIIWEQSKEKKAA